MLVMCVATVGGGMAHTGEEFENPISGERSVVRLGSDDTDGEAVVADLFLRPGAGGPREHVHRYLHETFEVLGGRVGFRLNGQEESTGPGRKLVVEPGMVHDFWNAGEQEAHVLVEIRPGRRFEQMIQALWGMAAAGETDARGAPKPLLRLAVVAKELEREFQFVSPPRWLQKGLFSVLAPIGHARGYKAIDSRYLELARRRDHRR
jgi:quercetin dioxygenase-like cupin family protein